MLRSSAKLCDAVTGSETDNTASSRNTALKVGRTTKPTLYNRDENQLVQYRAFLRHDHNRAVKTAPLLNPL